MILWQHVFWFFGHPEVYMLILGAWGIVTEIVSVFSGKPIFSYRGVVLSFLLITALSFSVWAHHMFATGAVELPFFSVTTELDLDPDRRALLHLAGHAVERSGCDSSRRCCSRSASSRCS